MVQSAELRRGSIEKIPGKSEGNEVSLAIQGKPPFSPKVKRRLFGILFYLVVYAIKFWISSSFWLSF